jgi:hypothetical protein
MKIKLSLHVIKRPVARFTIRPAGSIGKGKGKAIPLQPFTGPEGSSRLRLPDIKAIGT